MLINLYTLRQVAEICRLSIKTVYNHVWQGKLKTYKKQYAWNKIYSFVTEDDFKKYLFRHFFMHPRKKSKKKPRKES